MYNFSLPSGFDCSRTNSSLHLPIGKTNTGPAAVQSSNMYAVAFYFHPRDRKQVQTLFRLTNVVTRTGNIRSTYSFSRRSTRNITGLIPATNVTGVDRRFGTGFISTWKQTLDEVTVRISRRPKALRQRLTRPRSNPRWTVQVPSLVIVSIPSLIASYRLCRGHCGYSSAALG